MNRFSSSRFVRRVTTRTGAISTIAALLVGTMFYKLGLWQLSRADEKTSIVQTYQAATELPPVTLLDADAEKILYRRVELIGNLDSSRVFLLDNKIVAGQAGYEVIAPFMPVEDDRTANGYVLVNLGWIGHNGDRKVNIAADDIPSSQMTLEGIVVTPSKGFVLKESGAGQDSNNDPNNDPNTDQGRYPFTLQYIDYETIAVKLDKIPLMDAVIVAAEGQAGGFTYNYKPVASGASKHIGYAFQWFAMLFALIVLYLYLMVFKKADE